MKKFSLPALCAVLLLLSACGGGGGDDSFSGAGGVVLSLQPSSIDVGDRTRVTLNIFEVNEDGVVVKVNFPEALSYVGGTAKLVIDGDEEEIEPDESVDGDDEDRFLVFFLAEDIFDRDGEGTVQFELQARDSLSDGEVSVDIDVDDPTVPNNREFSVETPQFQAEDTAQIQIDK
ncbi:hypothetical protein MRY87_00740 [bacterium]|nr:hypothetical protein [bacterium]